MSRPASQMNPQGQVQLQMQMNQARAVNAMKVGLEFLIDDSVIGPIKYSDGLADLKWMLRGLLSGQFGLNLDVEGSTRPAVSGIGKDLKEIDLDDGDGEAGGE